MFESIRFELAHGHDNFINILQFGYQGTQQLSINTLPVEKSLKLRISVPLSHWRRKQFITEGAFSGTLGLCGAPHFIRCPYMSLQRWYTCSNVKYKVYVDLCSTLRKAPLMRSDIDHTVLPANYTIPAFTPHPQSITALWLVLILPSHGG